MFQIDIVNARATQFTPTEAKMRLTGFHNVHGSSKNHKKKKGIMREKILFIACSNPLAPTLFQQCKQQPRRHFNRVKYNRDES
jgi:hypothetical protein